MISAALLWALHPSCVSVCTVAPRAAHSDGGVAVVWCRADNSFPCLAGNVELGATQQHQQYQSVAKMKLKCGIQGWELNLSHGVGAAERSRAARSSAHALLTGTDLSSGNPESV